MTIGCSCGWRLETEPGWDIEELFTEHYRNTSHDHMGPKIDLNSAAESSAV